LSNLHKIGKYSKEIEEKSGNYQQNWNFHIVSIDTKSAPAYFKRIKKSWNLGNKLLQKGNNNLCLLGEQSFFHPMTCVNPYFEFKTEEGVHGVHPASFTSNSLLNEV